MFLVFAHFRKYKHNKRRKQQKRMNYKRYCRGKVNARESNSKHGEREFSFTLRREDEKVIFHMALALKYFLYWMWHGDTGFSDWILLS